MDCRANVNGLFNRAVTVRWNTWMWHLPQEIGFVHYAGVTSRNASRFIMNYEEAEIAIRLAKVIMQYCRDVLIISPYKAQVALAAQKWEAT